MVMLTTSSPRQHGSIYWSEEGNRALQKLDPEKGLEVQLGHAFSWPYSPNWQDASTQKECDDFDAHLGDEWKLAINTGSKAHHVRAVSFLGLTD